MLSLFIGLTVSTPYGISIIINIIKDNNNNIKQVICQPLEWKLAQDQIPTFYMNPNDIKPIKNISNINSYSKNQYVMSNYGIGQLKKKRKSDGICEVNLVDWTLANGKNPVLFCKLDNIQKFNAGDRIITKPTKDTNNTNDTKETKDTNDTKEDLKARIQKLIADGIASKEKASLLFKQEKFEEAKEEYIKAIQITQYLGDNIDNEDRATVFEFTVPCHNNVALCNINLKKYDEGIQYATNSLTMVNALEARKLDSLVWKCLIERGMTEEKVFIETKKKSLFLMGKANLLSKNYDIAITQLEEALSLIKGDPSKINDANKIREFLTQAKRSSKKESQKEKATWSKAFEANKNLNDDAEKATPSTTTPPSRGATNDNLSSKNGNTSNNGIFNFDVKRIVSDTVGNITGKSYSNNNNGNDNKDDDDKNKIIKFDDSTYTWVLGFIIFGSITIGSISYWAVKGFRFRRYN